MFRHSVIPWGEGAEREDPLSSTPPHPRFQRSSPAPWGWGAVMAIPYGKPCLIA